MNSIQSNPALVVLSGGQDSTTCLYHMLQSYDHIFCLTIDYGQRHRREIDAATRVVDLARRQYPNIRILHEVMLVRDNILLSSSPLLRAGDDLEQYSGWAALPGGVEKTFVPLRNQLFLTIAANRAVAIDAVAIVTGVSEEDYGGYPDCREAYIYALEKAINLSLEGVHSIRILTPLMHMSKAGTVHMAYNLPGCWEAMALTHTSYDGAYPPTGHDHATLLRAKGFFEAGLPDPLVLRAHSEGLMPLPSTSNYQAAREGIEFVGTVAT